jgi:type I restriction-modification system DNA methylase subunit
MELETGGKYTDVLGALFHELELHNKYKGQFFTPMHVCTLMGALVGVDKKDIEEHGYTTMNEPCCGSGAMILGFINSMIDAKLNHQKQLLVIAQDIDIKCVHMTYLQLALAGVPAVVIHGNTLTLEEWSHWFTPMYVLGGWRFKTNKEGKDDG